MMKNRNFSQQVYTPNVDEIRGANTLVTTVVASDKDGDNVRFGFVGGGTSRITLDRDKYELNVTAMDDAFLCVNGDQNNSLPQTAVVVVFITDVNDNKPVFKRLWNLLFQK
ncbi:hypothetical protein PVAND_005361 [Polypedilum vanderplanki]|uniref:Cadherin domain-containing protein n=1 Tax=Polypedilum vanderplanki TaxID=319348 RepID=A0A9J6BZQ4_POLVA|nr:hypothetical protein PVAND_005361 [Polypedilum vanderplanki]